MLKDYCEFRGIRNREDKEELERITAALDTTYIDHVVAKLEAAQAAAKKK